MLSLKINTDTNYNFNLSQYFELLYLVVALLFQDLLIKLLKVWKIKDFL